MCMIVLNAHHTWHSWSWSCQTFIYVNNSTNAPHNLLASFPGPIPAFVNSLVPSLQSPRGEGSGDIEVVSRLFVVSNSVTWLQCYVIHHTPVCMLLPNRMQNRRAVIQLVRMKQAYWPWWTLLCNRMQNQRAVIWGQDLLLNVTHINYNLGTGYLIMEMNKQVWLASGFNMIAWYLLPTGRKRKYLENNILLIAHLQCIKYTCNCWSRRYKCIV